MLEKEKQKERRKECKQSEFRRINKFKNFGKKTFSLKRGRKYKCKK